MAHRQPPVHVTPEHLLHFVYSDNLVLAPKADGRTAVVKVADIEMEAEYILELNLYLVFDLVDKTEPNILKRMEKIKNIHIYNDHFASLDDIKSLIERDNHWLKIYLKQPVLANEIRWFPKTVFKNNLTRPQLLHLLDADIPMPYPTDGWVLTLSNERMGKYKPKRELTIDVQCHGRYWTSKDGKIVTIKPATKTEQKLGVWRCYFDETKKIWVAREFRPEKKFANSQRIINIVESQLLKNWRASDYIKFVETHKCFYYLTAPMKECDTDTKKFLISQRDTMIKWLTPHLRKSKTVLDLGCGRGTISKLCTDQKITGVDIDPSSIHISMSRYPQHDWIWADMREFKSDEKYDIIILNFTVQYILPDLNDFLLSLQKLSHEKTVWCISFMDAEKIDKKIEFIKRDEDKITVSFPWATEHKELILTFEQLSKELEKMQMSVDQPVFGDSPDISEKYLRLHSCYRWLTCTKMQKSAKQ